MSDIIEMRRQPLSLYQLLKENKFEVEYLDKIPNGRGLKPIPDNYQIKFEFFITCVSVILIFADKQGNDDFLAVLTNHNSKGWREKSRLSGTEMFIETSVIKTIDNVHPDLRAKRGIYSP